MRINKKHLFVLFALYQYFREANKQFQKAPLTVSVSKIVFIELLKKLKLADKSERALYKNLEVLEKKKLLRYENRFLKPTKRGLKLYKKMLEEFEPYFHLMHTIKGNVAKLTRKAQTFFKQENI